MEPTCPSITNLEPVAATSQEIAKIEYAHWNCEDKARQITFIPKETGDFKKLAFGAGNADERFELHFENEEIAKTFSATLRTNLTSYPKICCRLYQMFSGVYIGTSSLKTEKVEVMTDTLSIVEKLIPHISEISSQIIKKVEKLSIENPFKPAFSFSPLTLNSLLSKISPSYTPSYTPKPTTNTTTSTTTTTSIPSFRPCSENLLPPPSKTIGNWNCYSEGEKTSYKPADNSKSKDSIEMFRISKNLTIITLKGSSARLNQYFDLFQENFKTSHLYNSTYYTCYLDRISIETDAIAKLSKNDIQEVMKDIFKALAVIAPDISEVESDILEKITPEPKVRGTILKLNSTTIESLTLRIDEITYGTNEDLDVNRYEKKWEHCLIVDFQNEAFTNAFVNLKALNDHKPHMTLLSKTSLRISGTNAKRFDLVRELLANDNPIHKELILKFK